MADSQLRDDRTALEWAIRNCGTGARLSNGRFAIAGRAHGSRMGDSQLRDGRTALEWPIRNCGTAARLPFVLSGLNERGKYEKCS